MGAAAAGAVDVRACPGPIDEFIDEWVRLLLCSRSVWDGSYYDMYTIYMTRGASATTYTQRRKRSTARTQAGWSRAYVRAYRGAVAPQSDVRCPCVCVGAERRFLVLVSLLLFVFLLLFLLITTAVRSKYSCW